MNKFTRCDSNNTPIYIDLTKVVAVTIDMFGSEQRTLLQMDHGSYFIVSEHIDDIMLLIEDIIS